MTGIRSAARVAPYSWSVELSALGIGADQEAIYRALVATGPASERQLRERGIVGERVVNQVLDDLLEAGLATREDDGRLRASPPELALRSLLIRRRAEIGKAESALAELTELFRTTSTDSVRDLVEVVTGVDAVGQRFTQLQHGADSLVRAFVRTDPAVVTAEQNTAEDEALGRGVPYRVVIERAVLEAPGALASVEESAAAGEDIRSVDTLPLRMLIADDSMALVPLASSVGPGAVVVRQSGLLDALIALFEQTWKHAVPVVVDPPAAEGELDSRIIALLLQGYGDKSISAQLGVSARTVQRRIRFLMDRAGVETRIQLGHWLGRRSVSGSS